MKSRLIVCAIIKKDDTILLGQKPPGKGPYPDTWHIPGGGMKLGEETAEEAIVREIQEETGLTVKNIEKVRWDTDVEPDKHGEPTYYVFLQFVCAYDTGEIRADDDIQHAKWVKIADLPSLNLNKPLRGLLKKINLL